MPSIYDIKPKFQALLRPLVRLLASVGITANQVTISAMLLSLTVGAWLVWRPDDPRALLVMGPFLFCRMALNAVDGMLAREHGQQSALGAWLNELGDVIADAGLYLPLALVEGFPPILVISAVVLAICTEMAGVVSVQMGGTRRYEGPMGKSDRAFVFGLAALLMGLEIEISSFLLPVFVLVNILLLVTLGNRLSRTLGELDA